MYVMMNAAAMQPLPTNNNAVSVVRFGFASASAMSDTAAPPKKMAWLIFRPTRSTMRIATRMPGISAMVATKMSVKSSLLNGLPFTPPTAQSISASPVALHSAPSSNPSPPLSAPDTGLVATNIPYQVVGGGSRRPGAEAVRAPARSEPHKNVC